MDPNDEARVLALEQKVKVLETNITDLVNGFNKLINEFFPPFVARIKALEDAPAKPAKKSSPAGTRKAMTYATYLQVKGLDAGGKTRKQIVEQLGIPYTTVSEYLKWTEKQVAEAAQREQLAPAQAASAKPATEGFDAPPDDDQF